MNFIRPLLIWLTIFVLSLQCPGIDILGFLSKLYFATQNWLFIFPPVLTSPCFASPWLPVVLSTGILYGLTISPGLRWNNLNS